MQSSEKITKREEKVYCSLNAPDMKFGNQRQPQNGKEKFGSADTLLGKVRYLYLRDPEGGTGGVFFRYTTAERLS